MRVLKTVAVKHPKDFSNTLLSVSAHRDVFRILPNGDNNIAVDIVTSKVITLEEFRTSLEQVYGPAHHFENFVDPNTGHEIVRCLFYHEGVQKCVYQRYDELTEELLDDVLKALELTKRMNAL